MEKIIKGYNKIAEKAILEYANADEWDDLATDDWDAVDVQKIIVNVLMEREANKESASGEPKHEILAVVVNNEAICKHLDTCEDQPCIFDQCDKYEPKGSEVAVCSFENKCMAYQGEICDQKTCGDFHKAN